MMDKKKYRGYIKQLKAIGRNIKTAAFTSHSGEEHEILKSDIGTVESAPLYIMKNGKAVRLGTFMTDLQDAVAKANHQLNEPFKSISEENIKVRKFNQQELALLENARRYPTLEKALNREVDALVRVKRKKAGREPSEPVTDKERESARKLVVKRLLDRTHKTDFAKYLKETLSGIIGDDLSSKARNGLVKILDATALPMFQLSSSGGHQVISGKVPTDSGEVEVKVTMSNGTGLDLERKADILGVNLEPKDEEKEDHIKNLLHETLEHLRVKRIAGKLNDLLIKFDAAGVSETDPMIQNLNKEIAFLNKHGGELSAHKLNELAEEIEDYQELLLDAGTDEEPETDAFKVLEKRINNLETNYNEQHQTEYVDINKHLFNYLQHFVRVIQEHGIAPAGPKTLQKLRALTNIQFQLPKSGNAKYNISHNVLLDWVKTLLNGLVIMQRGEKEEVINIVNLEDFIRSCLVYNTGGRYDVENLSNIHHVTKTTRDLPGKRKQGPQAAPRESQDSTFIPLGGINALSAAPSRVTPLTGIPESVTEVTNYQDMLDNLGLKDHQLRIDDPNLRNLNISNTSGHPNIAKAGITKMPIASYAIFKDDLGDYLVWRKEGSNVWHSDRPNSYEIEFQKRKLKKTEKGDFAEEAGKSAESWECEDCGMRQAPRDIIQCSSCGFRESKQKADKLYDAKTQTYICPECKSEMKALLDLDCASCGGDLAKKMNVETREPKLKELESGAVKKIKTLYKFDLDRDLLQFSKVLDAKKEEGGDAHAAHNLTPDEIKKYVTGSYNMPGSDKANISGRHGALAMFIFRFIYEEMLGKGYHHDLKVIREVDAPPLMSAATELTKILEDLYKKGKSHSTDERAMKAFDALMKAYGGIPEEGKMGETEETEEEE